MAENPTKENTMQKHPLDVLKAHDPILSHGRRQPRPRLREDDSVKYKVLMALAIEPRTVRPTGVRYMALQEASRCHEGRVMRPCGSLP
jgi:hypothetical protein